MGISGFIGRRNIQELEIEIDAPEEIYASKPFACSVRLINRRRYLPAFLIRVRISDYNVLFPFTDNGHHSSAYMDITLESRGVHRIEHIYVCSPFPFNFFVRCKSLNSPIEFVVFPTPISCDALSDAETRSREFRGDSASNRRGFESEMLSIRKYIAGDPLKYINWKATAKTGDLKTKELSSLFHQPIVVDLKDLPFETETRLSYAAYIINNLYGLGIPFGLRIEDRLFEPDHSLSHKIRLLRVLGLYGTDRT